jgi:DNA-binding transcriptional regulator GbsR (MarR family)
MSSRVRRDILNLLNMTTEATSKAQSTFIEDMGQMMVGWGIARTSGRIYAYLLLKKEPATLDDIAAELGIAKSGASVAARRLVQLGLARAAGQPGSRRVLYEPLDNLEAMTSARTTQMHQLVTRLRQGARAASGTQSRQRMEVMADWCDALIKEFPLLIRRLDKRRTK